MSFQSDRYVAAAPVFAAALCLLFSTPVFADALPLKERFRVVHEGSSYGRAVEAVAVCPSGKCFVSLSRNRSVMVWPLGAKAVAKPSQSLKVDDQVNDIAIDPKGSTVAVLTEHNGVMLWPMKGATTSRVEFKDDEGRNVAIKRVGFHASSGAMAAVAYTGHAFLTNGKKVVKAIEMQEGFIYNPSAVMYTPSGKTISIANEGGVTLLSATDGKLLTSAGGQADLDAFMISQAGIRGRDGTLWLCVRSISSGKMDVHFVSKESWPKPARKLSKFCGSAIVHSPVADQFAVVRDNVLQIVSYEEKGANDIQGTVIAELQPEPGMVAPEVRSLAYTADGKTLIAGTAKNDILVFDLP